MRCNWSGVRAQTEIASENCNNERNSVNDLILNGQRYAFWVYYYYYLLPPPFFFVCFSILFLFQFFFVYVNILQICFMKIRGTTSESFWTYDEHKGNSSWRLLNLNRHSLLCMVLYSQKCNVILWIVNNLWFICSRNSKRTDKITQLKTQTVLTWFSER